MIESLIVLLIYVAILCLVIYGVLWVLGAMGIGVPAHIVRIVWIIVALLVLLWVVQVLLTSGPGMPRSLLR